MPVDGEGQLEHHSAGGVQLSRGFLTTGLGFQVLGFAKLELDSGADGSVDSVILGGQELLTAPVDYNGTLAQTALDTADNINANHLAHIFFALANGDDVDMYQRKAGELFGAALVLVSTSTTIVTIDNDIGGSTDVITIIASGEAGILAANHYQMKIDQTDWATEIPDEPMAPALKLMDLTFTPSQDVVMCAGRVMVVANAIKGRPFTASEEKTIPWIRGSAVYIVKIAADGVFDYYMNYI